MADQELSIVKSEPLPELTIADTPEPASAASRFGGAVLGALTSPVHFAQALVTDPKGLYESLVNQSAEHFEKASQLWQDKQYGPAIHRAIAGVIPPYGVVPDAADKIRAGDVAGGVGEAVGSGLTPKVMSAIPAVTRGAVRAAPVVARTAVQAGAKAADVLENNPAAAAAVGGVVGYVHGGPMGAVEGVLGGGAAARGLRILRTVQKLQKSPEAPTTPSAAGGPPRLVGKAPTLTDSLSSIMDELRTENGADANVAPAVPGAAPGGEQAGRATMQALADQPSMASRTRLKAPTPPAAPVLRPVPLGQAMAVVRDAAPAAKVKLTAVQTKAAMDLVRQGHPVDEVLDAVQVLQQLKDSPSFAAMPTETEMRADMAQRAVGGQKSLMGEYGPKAPVKGKSPQQLLNEEAIARRRAREPVAATGNPFR